MGEIYLDNNATTAPLAEVRQAMLEVLEDAGNPSSAHGAGGRARKHMKDARERVAALLDVVDERVIFTSGGTEANALVLFSARPPQANRPRVITTRVEHSSVLHACERLEAEGAVVDYLEVDRSGRISLEQLEELLASDEASLVSIQWINNETGVEQPIPEAAALCARHGVKFHTDAAQAVGKVEMQLDSLPIDFLTLTAHKFHGPTGVGALYAKDPRSLRPLVGNGTQEGGRRPGTENLPGIVGMGVAAELRSECLEEVRERVGKLRDRFEVKVVTELPFVSVNGDPDRRIWNSTNLCFHGLDGQALVAQLDGKGIRCSQSSACTNRSPEPSHVLRAMGLSLDDAFSSVRFSFSELNTAEEADAATEQVIEIARRLHRLTAGPLAGAPEEAVV